MITPPSKSPPPGIDDNKPEEYTSRTSSRFRFKSKRESEDSEEYRRSRDRSGDRERSHRHHRHHDRRKRRKRSSTHSCPQDDPNAYEDTHLPNTSSEQSIDPETAFRESLFDAMADDEAADYWQAVYGQPIHVYPDVKQGPEGKLERMTDEEYTAYVRGKMYEKTHQHLIEEKARRDAARKERERLAKEGRKAESDARKFRSEIEESLKRGQERKLRRVWADKWDAYTQGWEELGKGTSDKVAVASIPWPVESGRRQDIEIGAVRQFFVYGPSGGNPTEQTLLRALKLERVRWHPDKIQQKLGGQDVDATVMQGVTEVFQIIDRIWSELRRKP